MSKKISISKMIAPEDIRPGQYITILSIVDEVPSYMWDHIDPAVLAPEKLVRIEHMWSGGQVLKVKEVCLPLVFIRTPCGGLHTIDVRRFRLARLSDSYGRSVWKALKKRAKEERSRDREAGKGAGPGKKCDDD